MEYRDKSLTVNQARAKLMLELIVDDATDMLKEIYKEKPLINRCDKLQKNLIALMEYIKE